MAKSLKIPITKAGKGAFLEVDTDALPLEMYELAMMEGLKVLLNAKMSKITGVTKMEGEELAKAQSDAMTIAQSNLEALNKGTIKAKRTAAAKSGVPREVQTEALRLARDVIRNELRKANIKPSHIPASEITGYAKQLIEGPDGAELIAKARENVASRADVTNAIPGAGFIDLSKAMAESEAVKAKRAATKKASPTLSKTQAGLVAKRKPQAPQPTAH